MSDLQDVIASTSIKAFNSGYLEGAWDERERIVKLLESQLGAYYSEPVTMDDGLKAAIALVREVQK